MQQLFDQSVFVTDARNGVVKEALIAACLTAMMILVFLGSWRSTLIIAVSIPLSILVSLLLLDALGYTLNVMTLGGLSLAVGILVDDATVELENIHRNLGMDNKPLTKAVLDGAQQIAVPAFVATLSICIVFVSVVFLTGPAKFLFVPLALAVVFAMMTSYLLSRTLVPVMVHFLLGPEVALYREEAANEPQGGKNGQGKKDETRQGTNRSWRSNGTSTRNWLAVARHHGAIAEPPSRRSANGTADAIISRSTPTPARGLGAEGRGGQRQERPKHGAAGSRKNPRTRIGSGASTSGSTATSRNFRSGYEGMLNVGAGVPRR